MHSNGIHKYAVTQIMTDRFGSTQPGVEDAPCTGLDNYWYDMAVYCCARTPPLHVHSSYGNWAGTQQHMQYITNLNFLAVWTSPITANSPGGYHGYWYADRHILLCLPFHVNSSGLLL